MMSNNDRFHEAMYYLQEKGYYEDFIIFGDDIFWVQQKAFLNRTEFCIAGCLSLAHPKGKDEDLVLFCIEIIPSGNKGILMTDYCFTRETPSVLLEKMRERKNYFYESGSIRH